MCIHGRWWAVRHLFAGRAELGDARSPVLVRRAFPRNLVVWTSRFFYLTTLPQLNFHHHFESRILRRSTFCSWHLYNSV